MTHAYAHQPEKDITNLSMVSKKTQIWLCQARMLLGGVQRMYFYGESRKTILREGTKGQYNPVDKILNSGHFCNAVPHWQFISILKLLLTASTVNLKREQKTMLLTLIMINKWPLLQLICLSISYSNSENHILMGESC